jgi:hypothetical protein
MAWWRCAVPTVSGMTIDQASFADEKEAARKDDTGLADPPIHHASTGIAQLSTPSTTVNRRSGDLEGNAG